MKPIKILSLNCFCIALAWSQSVNLVAVISKTLSRTVELPGEFQPFMSVSVHAKVRGYVDRVLVDRGSIVKKGQLLAQLTAPEMKAQIAEAQSKAQGAESARIDAEAQLSAAHSTAARTAKAAETPGAIAGNELIQAQKQVEAAKALVEAKRQGNEIVTGTEAQPASTKVVDLMEVLSASIDSVKAGRQGAKKAAPRTTTKKAVAKRPTPIKKTAKAAKPKAPARRKAS